MRRAVLAAAGLLLTAALAGCGGSTATTPAGTVAQAAPGGFVESDKVDGIPVKLAIEPFQPGSNRFMLTTNEAGIATAETQVVMLEMGHGGILDMEATAPGQYEISSPVINMDGKWMFRVKLTTTAGDERLFTFYGKVKTTQ